MNMQSGPLPDDVLAALQRGQTIEAIKLLRGSTGLGLAEAKDLIDRHLGGRPVSIARSTPLTELPADVAAAMQQGNKLEAIRLLREHTGIGLKEAKEAVESIGRRSSAQAGAGSPGEVPRSGGRMGLVVAFIGAALLVYLLSRSSG